MQLTLPEEYWLSLHALLNTSSSSNIGRPRENDRKVATAVYNVLLNNMKWSELPPHLGARSTIHGRFKEWEEQGAIQQAWPALWAQYDSRRNRRRA